MEVGEAVNHPSLLPRIVTFGGRCITWLFVPLSPFFFWLVYYVYLTGRNGEPVSRHVL